MRLGTTLSQIPFYKVQIGGSNTSKAVCFSRSILKFFEKPLTTSAFICYDLSVKERREKREKGKEEERKHGKRGTVKPLARSP